jgi:hypothetical protein
MFALVLRWTGFVAGLWSGDPAPHRTAPWRRRARRATLAVAFLVLPGCSELAQPSGVMPSGPEPPYVSLVSRYLQSTLANRAIYEGFEISGLRWVHSIKGWSWLACVHFADHGHRRSYALFIAGDAVIDARFAVETDACDAQTYTPFDVTTGTLGKPTPAEQPPLY